MSHYLSSASLKAQARGQLLGKYGTVIGIYVLHILCIIPFMLAVSSVIGTGSVGAILIYCIATFLFELFAGFFTAGEAYVYLKVACNQRPLTGDLFYCFREDHGRVVRIQAVLSAISIISSLPAMIVKHYMSRSFPGILLNLPSGNIADGGAVYSPGVNASLFLAYVVLYLLGTIITVFARLLFSQTYYLMLDFPEYSASLLLKTSVRLMKGSKGRLFYIWLSFVPLLIFGGLSFCIGLLWLLPYMEAVSANFYLDLIRKRQEPSS